MLTPAQIRKLRKQAAAITDPVSEYLLQEIVRRVAHAGELTSTAAYQVWRARQMGVPQMEVEGELHRLLDLSRREIQKIMYESVQSGYDLDVRRFPQAVPFERNAVLQQIVSAAVKLAQDDFTNLTQTIGMVDPYGNALPLQDACRACTDFAFKQVITGAASYTEAVRRAARNLADKGLRTIDYESGVHTSLEAAVRRNIMGGLGLMQEQVSQTVHDQLGCDGWEITAHANSAPDHEPIQGKQYSDADYQALNNSLRRRIGTLNCGHAAFPIILGVNKPQYTAEELEKFRRDNETGVTIDGVHYSGYEATQMQRELERAIRKQKNRIIVDEAAGDTEKLERDKIKLNILRQRYAEFSEAAGLRTQMERTEVAGFGEKPRTVAETLNFVQDNLTREGEVFDPEIAKNSLLERLENSPGLADNIATLRYYAETTKLISDTGFSGPIGYNPNPRVDAILYNPDKFLPPDTDRDGIFIHELAHRADILVYHTAHDSEWMNAIQIAENAVMKNVQSVEAWFEPGAKYEKNGFFADIISALSKGEINTPYGHDKDVWATGGVREQEIFANIAALDVLLGMDGMPSEDGFEALYTTFEKIIKRGIL